MPRIPRNAYKDKKLFHVMVQGINKEKIFLEEKQKLEYIKLINKFKIRYLINVIAYCVMDNHVHILIKTDEVVNLTNYMHYINTVYAMYYNKSKNRVGYVYRDRFKTQVIRDEKHLYNCIIYIHNNPVKAKICNTPQDYRFSSYQSFFRQENKEILNELFINKNYYIKAHQRIDLLNIDFLEDKEEKNIEIKNYIEEYLNTKKVNILELRINNELLISLALRLRECYKLSYREIEKYLGVNREKIRRLIK